MDFFNESAINGVADGFEAKIKALASIFAASKYEEIYPPKLSDFCAYESGLYAKESVLECEAELLLSLQFDTTRVLAYDFFEIFA